MSTDALQDVVQELYALPPGEFTAARNAAAKQAKAEDKDLAQRIQGLRKPSLAAWVVNMMVRHQAEQMAQVLELGEALRQSQADLDADTMRELTRQRRRLTAAVTTQGRSLAAELGERVSEAVARQVEETLHAAMIDAAAAGVVRTGLLVEPLTATGVGSLDVASAVADPALAGVEARPVERPARERAELSVVQPDEDDQEAARRQALEEARAGAAAAQAAVDKAAKKLAKAGKRLSRLEARSLQVQGELEEVRRRAAALEQALEDVDEEIVDAEDTRDQATQRHQEAVTELATAQAEVDRLEG